VHWNTRRFVCKKIDLLAIPRLEFHVRGLLDFLLSVKLNRSLIAHFFSLISGIAGQLEYQYRTCPVDAITTSLEIAR
jgi:hypothetical protein